MEKQSKVKNKRKLINPIFHLQSQEEVNKYLSKEIIKDVRKTGILKLSGKHLAFVPEKLFSIYDSVDENSVNVDFNKSSTDVENWWNLKPLTNLDLSFNVITNLPAQISIFEDLTIINLQENSLTSLPPEITTLTKLTKLILNRNKINKLPEDISKLTELRILSLSHNCIEKLPKSMVDLVMLEKLDLSYNLIEKLPSGIGFLIRLTNLNISNNKLTKLPPDIVNLRNLLTLDINHNNIKYFPESFGELRKIQTLYAQHNDIKEIPNFAGCDCLQEIFLGNNFIKEFPKDFHENLMQLKILELRDNEIAILPNELAKMVNLTQLDLTNNELKEIPPVIGLLPHLQSFKIEGNKLKQIRADIIRTGTLRILQFLREKLQDEDVKTELIPNSFLAPVDSCIFPDKYKMKNSRMINLPMKGLTAIPETVFIDAQEAHVAIVDLCKNKLVEVPVGLKILTEYLTELNLSSNRINEIPEFISEFKKLKFLDLSGNTLNQLPEELNVMINLREIVLSHNRFTKIPSCIFNMVGLEILMLNDNKIEEINLKILNLKRLATLNLTNNNINIVPPQLGNMNHLKSLELKGNSFKQPRYAILEQGTESILSYLREKIPL